MPPLSPLRFRETELTASILITVGLETMISPLCFLKPTNPIYPCAVFLKQQQQQKSVVVSEQSEKALQHHCLHSAQCNIGVTNEHVEARAREQKFLLIGKHPTLNSEYNGYRVTGYPEAAPKLHGELPYFILLQMCPSLPPGAAKVVII